MVRTKAEHRLIPVECDSRRVNVNAMIVGFGDKVVLIVDESVELRVHVKRRMSRPVCGWVTFEALVF